MCFASSQGERPYRGCAFYPDRVRNLGGKAKEMTTSKRRSKLCIVVLILSLASITIGLSPNTAAAQSSLPPCQSYPNTDWTGCIGTYTHPEGRKYVGEFKDGKSNGRGTMAWPDGRKYVGEWRNGNRNGPGTMTWPDGAKYVGDWRDDDLNGQGTYTFRDGRKYVGGFRDSRYNGKGAFSYPNGAKYVGEFEDGLMSGQATYVWADGATQSGIWKDGKFVEGTTGISGIPIKIDGGTFIVPATINGKITLDFIIDSGASVVAVPVDVVSTLIRTGSIVKEDFLGESQFHLADGSTVPSPIFIIRSLKVGDKVVENVRASVAPVKANLLLGQSFLNRFNSWSVDNRQRLLFLN
jgi:clan AA aspartic protease (TIGR02281 family)